MAPIDRYREVWLVDYEFTSRAGERPEPICLVAHEWRTGQKIRLWRSDFGATAPYPTGRDVLFVAYYAIAEIGCHLALGWAVPVNVLDLFAEFRVLTNGRQRPCGDSLLGALAYHGLAAMDATEKEEMRALAMRGGQYTEEERSSLLKYCESDVLALTSLLARMEAGLDIDRALLRGRYMSAAARMEHLGVPIDTTTLNRLRDRWDRMKVDLVRKIDSGFGVYEAASFKSERFAAWLVANGIPWARHPSGKLKLDDDTFREMARVHAAVAPLRELRYSLGKLRLSELAVGGDGRNRCSLSAFRARTGRNQPSNSHFVFGPAVWVRSLIKPEPGMAVAYIDWGQQELGIAAALSGDPNLIFAYESGDPYLAFAVQAGAAPADATKESHGGVRELFKTCALGVLYGMGQDALAMRIGKPVAVARHLLELHRRCYPLFWRWSDAAVDHAMLLGRLHTVFGWPIYTGPDANPRSLRNFPMQANGAEMLRLACCLATEAGVRVIAPIHDALLIEASADSIEAAVESARGAMQASSSTVLGGFELRTDAEIVRAPDRYADARGAAMWSTVNSLLQDVA